MCSGSEQVPDRHCLHGVYHFEDRVVVPPQYSADRVILDVSSQRVMVPHAPTSASQRAPRDRQIQPEISARPRAGEPRPAATARHPGAMLETAAAPEARPDLLGLAVLSLVEMALRSRHRPAGNGRPLAPAGLQALLAMEVASENRVAEDRRRDPQADSAHVLGESALGNSTNPLGTPTPRLRGV